MSGEDAPVTSVDTTIESSQISSNPLVSSNPYVIHHSDSPSTVLVTPHLTGDNYGSWCRALTMALRAKSKYYFVDESLPKPTSVTDIATGNAATILLAAGF